jgi:hypothetical protein
MCSREVDEGVVRGREVVLLAPKGLTTVPRRRRVKQITSKDYGVKALLR